VRATTLLFLRAASRSPFFLVPPCAVKEKYGSDADTDDLDSDDSDSESDESEDEDGEELTPALDAAILRTLARIKARDPGIYDTGRNVFEGTTFVFSAFGPPSSPLPLVPVLITSYQQRSTTSLERYLRPHPRRKSKRPSL